MEHPNPARGRALVIDDDSEIRSLVASFLQILGFDAQMAATGLEGLRQLEQGTYALVVTDLAMPQMTGWEVIEGVRHRAPGLAVILTSGSTSSLDIDRARDSGAVLLEKPFGLEELEVAVEGAFRMKTGAPPALPRMTRGDEITTAAPGYPERSPEALRAVVRAVEEVAQQATAGLHAAARLMGDVLREREAWWDSWTTSHQEHRALRDTYETLAREHESTSATLAGLRQEHRSLEQEHDALVRLLAEIREGLSRCLGRIGH